ncbi:MAG: NYN domain-containing protein, partial [Lentisphaeria bacterium]|nr:NYN domain-containing protein [Lentisphaeria bacterium]
RVLAALAVCGRPALEARAWRCLRRPTLWRGDPPDGELPPDLSVFAELCANPANIVPADDGSAARKLSTLERELETSRANLGKTRDKLHHLQEELGATQTQARDAAREGRRALRTIEQTLAEARESAELQLAQRMRDFQTRFTGTITTCPPEDTAGKGDDTLPQRVENALRRQQRLDREHGVRATLRQRIAELEKQQGELELSVQESLFVLPEIHELHGLVSQQIKMLAAQLGDHVDESGMSDLEFLLQARVKTLHINADPTREAEAILQLLDSRIAVELLGDEAVAELRTLCRERVALTDHSQSAQESPAEAEPGQVPEVWSLDCAADSGECTGVWLLVDGYNVIKRTQALAALEAECGLAAARDKLVGLLERSASPFEGVEVVFDGTGQVSESEQTGRVRVVFSGCNADSQNADTHIVKRAEVQRGRGCGVWVVTDDYGLRERLEDICAAFVSPVHLVQFVQDGSVNGN